MLAGLVFALVLSLCGQAWGQATAMPDSVDPDLEETVEMEAVPDEKRSELEGLPIVEYELRCDLDLCSDWEVVERFKQMSGLAEGQIYRAARLERAQSRLAMTGFFRELSVEARREEDGVYVEIVAWGAVLIRRIKFDGLSPPPFEQELRNVLMYRPGQVFVDDADQAQAQLQSLEAMFEQEGFFGTRITLRAERLEDDPHLVDLTFEIERGQDRKICSLAFRGVRGMTSAQARETMLAGASLRRLPWSLPRFTSDQFREGREELIAEYRRRGYFRARIVDQAVQVDEATHCTRLIVDVSEGPLWDVQFHGNDSVRDAALRQALPFDTTGYVDDEEIRMAEHAVRQVYESQGYPFAEVQGREELEDRLDRRLVFEIEEGPRALVEAIRFHGVQQFSDREAMQGFGTQPFGLFDTGGYLLTEQLLSDFSTLEARYRELGFMRAVVESFSVELNDSADGVIIRIYVDEGERTEVGGVDVTGHQVVSDAEIDDIIEVSAGQPFVPLEVQADQARLSQHYGAIGYPQATVETTCRRGDQSVVACQPPRLPEGCQRRTFDTLVEEGCEWREGATPTWVCDRLVDEEHCQFEDGVVDDVITVGHDIEEGSQVRVGEILLKGNFRTRSGVIFRELPLRTGDVMDVQKLIEGQGNMRSLGIFDSVSIETIGLHDEIEDEDQSTADAAGAQQEQVASLIVSVEESRARFVDFRFGFEGRDLFADARRVLATGELQYTDQNLFGTGQRFRPRIIGATDTLDLFRLGADTTRELEVATDVTGLDYLFGAELMYSHPRFLRTQFGVNELLLTVTPFYLIDLLGVATDQQVLREEWGLRMELRKELDEIMERFYATFGIEAKQAATWSPGDLRVDGERVFSPRRATGKLIPELRIDRRDSPLNPSEGFHVQFRPELVSGDALAQDGEELIGDSYWRLSFAASYFWRIVDNLTLGQGMSVGQIVPVFDRQTLVPPDERFYMGGARTVRGFSTNTLGPVGDSQQPIGGEFMLNYSAELRYPLIEEWSLYGATFLDAGILVHCFDGDGRSARRCYENAFPDSAPLSQLRATAGMGLRYLLVDQIPVLLDYGMVLNRRPGEGFGSIHFNLGYTF